MLEDVYSLIRERKLRHYYNEISMATHFILSENSESLLTLSSLDSQQLDSIKQSISAPVAVLNIQRMNLQLLIFP